MNLVATSDEDQLSKMKANQDSSSSLFADNSDKRGKDAKSKKTTLLANIGKEDDEGNTEYKRSLISPSKERLEHLTTQLNFRLNEGSGESIYQIGVEDDGETLGIPEDSLKKSLKTLESMAASLDAETEVIRISPGQTEGCSVAEVLVRRKPGVNRASVEVRIAVVGNVDSGKSTLIGVLTKGRFTVVQTKQMQFQANSSFTFHSIPIGALDNGRGSARTNSFRHKHEFDSGRTSAVSQSLLGFGTHGDVTNYNDVRPNAMADVVTKSSKLVTFIDLAGHEKYLKTTVFGLTGNSPDYSMIMLGANMGVQRMTKEHLGLSLAGFAHVCLYN